MSQKNKDQNSNTENTKQRIELAEAQVQAKADKEDVQEIPEEFVERDPAREQELFKMEEEVQKQIEAQKKQREQQAQRQGPVQNPYRHPDQPDPYTNQNLMPETQPVGIGNVMAYPEKEGMFRYLVSDVHDGARIAEMLRAGYTFVKEVDPVNQKDQLGHKCGNMDTNGTLVCRNVGSGQRGYLMEIDEKIHKQHNAYRQKLIKQQTKHVQSPQRFIKDANVENTYYKPQNVAPHYQNSEQLGNIE